MIHYPDIETNDGSIVCSFPDGEFKETKFSVGKVSFEESGESLRMKFTYNVHENPPIIARKHILENMIGDYLRQEIEDRITNKKDIVYRGGISDKNTIHDDDENDEGIDED